MKPILLNEQQAINYIFHEDEYADEIDSYYDDEQDLDEANEMNEIDDKYLPIQNNRHQLYCNTLIVCSTGNAFAKIKCPKINKH